MSPFFTEDTSANGDAPAPCLYRAHSPWGWMEQPSCEGCKYLSLKLDDPSFTAPIYASLFGGDDGETFALDRAHCTHPTAADHAPSYPARLCRTGLWDIGLLQELRG